MNLLARLQGARRYSEPAPIGGFRNTVMTKIKHFLKDESGATAIEYGLIAAGISVAIITIVGTLGGKLNATFTNLSSKLK